MRVGITTLVTWKVFKKNILVYNFWFDDRHYVPMKYQNVHCFFESDLLHYHNHHFYVSIVFDLKHQFGFLASPKLCVSNISLQLISREIADCYISPIVHKTFLDGTGCLMRSTNTEKYCPEKSKINVKLHNCYNNSHPGEDSSHQYTSMVLWLKDHHTWWKQRIHEVQDQEDQEEELDLH